MTTKDPYNSLLTVLSLPPATRNATAQGTTVDRAAAGAMFQAAMVIVTCGVITDGTHTIVVQDSDDGAAWADVPDAQLQGVEPAIVAADDNKVFEIGYLGRKRYVRVNVTVVAGATGGVYGAAVVLADPRVAPTVHA